ncbi:MAG: NADH-quinone oxidoreductase subunit C [Acidobacteria bacterium]|nr:NADH-quinone oxidoreductase subunit C [Acidobacteriota bacterium]
MMKWLEIRNQERAPWRDVPVADPADLASDLVEKGDAGHRVVAFFGLREAGGVRLVAVTADDDRSLLHAASAKIPDGGAFPSATPGNPAVHLFEREIFEQFGVRPEGHPWLKPVRYAWDRADRSLEPESYPFFAMAGEEVHEVAVGPVHAGVIEPGHFRFQCTGERVHHLEIQLGYQHRGVETLLEAEPQMRDLQRCLLAESIAGDSAVAHAWACCGLLEALGEARVGDRGAALRAVGLELERAGNHLGDLSALCNDVAYLSGSAIFGALRTLTINSSLALCGSRYGRGLVRPGGVGPDPDGETAARIRRTLAAVAADAALIADVVASSAGVLSRMERTGTVSPETARRIGLVGPAGRASGLPVDVRRSHPVGTYRATALDRVRALGGDVLARAEVRVQEIARSAAMIDAWLGGLPEGSAGCTAIPPAAGAYLAVSMVEGWRGETVHVGITDDAGRIARHKVVDPSFHNWFGLALAVRGCGISDFPLCNKSFNLSYCGFDL